LFNGIYSKCHGIRHWHWIEKISFRQLPLRNLRNYSSSLPTKNGSIKFVQEPKGNKNLPSHMKWNPYKGEYYNASDFAWDSVENMYIDKSILKQVKGSNNISASKNTVEEFIDDSKNSDSQLDKAIVKYLEERDPKLDLYSYYNPDEDQAFINNLLSVDIKYLPKMLEYANEDKFSVLMMHAIARIAKVEDLTSFDLNPEGVDKWKKKFDDLHNSAPAVVKNFSDKVKTSADSKIIESSKHEVKKLGMLAVPYLIDEISNGNIALTNTVEEIINTNTKTFNKKNAKLEISKIAWNDWVQGNSDNIKTLKELASKK
jgi:hypothetical protein